MFQSTHPRRVRPNHLTQAPAPNEFQSTHPRRVRRVQSSPGNVVNWVSIHAPVKGATCLSGIQGGWRGSFNPRTREGCDLAVDFVCCQLVSFNPRTREGCDLITGSAKWSPKSFNPRTREGCDSVEKGSDTVRTSFNPRTREGCDNSLGIEVVTFGVSIHAPAKGATQYGNLASTRYQFQSTHPRRVRLNHEVDILSVIRFNPRTREGCDCSLLRLWLTSPVSIHAPAKGATLLVDSGRPLNPCFNPRTREGCDDYSCRSAAR